MFKNQSANQLTVPEIDLAHQFAQVSQLPLSEGTRELATRDIESLYQGRVGRKPNWLRIWAFNYGMPIPQEEPEYTGA